MSSVKQCCVPKCKESGVMYQELHAFPDPQKDRERFKIWLNTIGGDILNLDYEHIFKYLRVCRSHFEERYICRNNRVSSIAVPTLNIPALWSPKILTSDNGSPLQQVLNLPSTSSHINNIEVTERVRLSGAARKRFRRLMAAEIGAEKALALCRKPWDQIPVGNPPPDPKAKKRLRSEEESLREQPRETPRLDLMSPPPKAQYSVVAGAVRVGVRNSDPMSEEQMRLLHDAFLESIVKMAGKKGVPRPRFTAFSYKTGWVLVTCENQDSHNWLVGEVKQIKPWPEAELSTIPESELPRPPVGTTFIPISEAATVEIALRLLEVQNDGLNPGLWRVLRKRAEAGGTLVTFLLDDPSAETLLANNGRAGLGFKYIVFKVRGGSAVENPSVETPRPSTSAGAPKASAAVDYRPRWSHKWQH